MRVEGESRALLKQGGGRVEDESRALLCRGEGRMRVGGNVEGETLSSRS